MLWINVEDALPPFEKEVIVCDEINKCYGMGKLSENEECFLFSSLVELPCDSEITHWMEYPPLPGE